MCPLHYACGIYVIRVIYVSFSAFSTNGRNVFTLLLGPSAAGLGQRDVIDVYHQRLEMLLLDTMADVRKRCLCMRSKDLPRAGHSVEIVLARLRRLRSTLAAAPVLFAHAVVTVCIARARTSATPSWILISCSCRCEVCCVCAF